MRTIRLFVGAAVLATVLAVPANAGVNSTITIAGFDYLPANKVANVLSSAYSLGFDNEDSVPHSGTAKNGMFDTGNIPGGASDSVLLFGAGSYPYFCTVHGAASMSAKVSLRPTASDTSILVGESVTIRVGADGLKGTTFDVQRRRNGGEWRTIRVDTTDPTPAFTMQRAGTYDFRSKIEFKGLSSRYSPFRTVTVSAA